MTHISSNAAAAARPAGAGARPLATILLGAGLVLGLAAAGVAWSGSSIAAGPLESRSVVASARPHVMVRSRH
jgi:hypothetical protein